MTEAGAVERSVGAPVWSAAIAAGAIGSIVFLVLEMLLLPLVLAVSPWVAIRMIAAIVMGSGVLPPPATFDAAIFGVALLLHVGLSMLYAALFVFLFWRLPSTSMLIAGAAFGLSLYLVNFHLLTLAFPWFADMRGLLSVVLHIVFGLVVAWTYVAFAKLSTRRYPRGAA